MDKDKLYIDDVGYVPKKFVACRRLGMSKKRHYQLLHRIFDDKYSKNITKDPRVKNSKEGIDYVYL